MDKKQSSFPVLDCIITYLYQRQLFFISVTQKSNSINEPQISDFDSDSNSLAELEDPETTTSLEPSSNLAPQASNCISQVPQVSVCRTPWNNEQIDYQKSHIKRASITKTNSIIPYNSSYCNRMRAACLRADRGCTRKSQKLRC